MDCLEDALRVHGTPEVFNSDQGVQFTSETFTGVLKREEITISMIVDKYGAKEGLPVALCYSGTEFRKDSLEKTLGIEFKNRGSAEQLHET